MMGMFPLCPIPHELGLFSMLVKIGRCDVILDNRFTACPHEGRRNAVEPNPAQRAPSLILR